MSTKSKKVFLLVPVEVELYDFAGNATSDRQMTVGSIRTPNEEEVSKAIELGYSFSSKENAEMALDTSGVHRLTMKDRVHNHIKERSDGEEA